MAGNYALPFRLPPAGSIIYSHPNHLSGCDVAARWQNVTRVRAAGSGSPPTVGSIAPFARVDTDYDQGPEGADSCPTSPPGTCGDWLVKGDLLGLSEQLVTDTVNDIMACGALPVMGADHNCYAKNGVVSYKKCRQTGGKWVVAQKYWHGVLGINDRDDPAPFASATCTTGADNAGGGAWATPQGFNNASPQVRFRTVSVAVSGTLVSMSHNPHDIPPGTYKCSAQAASTVGRLTGIQQYSSDVTTDPHGYIKPDGIFGLLLGFDHDEIIRHFIAGWMTYPGAETRSPGGIYTQTGPKSWAYSFEETDPGNSLYPMSLASTVMIDPGGSCAMTMAWSGPSGVWSRAESISWGNEGLSYEATESYTGNDSGTLETTTWNGTVSLTDAYTSADCYADWLALMTQWDLTSDTVYPWRTDEELALAPLVVYDEVGPTVPVPTYQTMDDWTQPQNPDSTWPQRPYLDPNDYVWLTPSGGFVGLPVATGGNLLRTPMRSGTMVSHNPAGSDPHFWFGFARYQRLEAFYNPGNFIWYLTEHGGYSDGALPTATLRWQDRLAAQYDAEAQRANDAPPGDGNLPEAWLRESNATLIGGKYVEAKELWQSVNFGRPHGLDKFAVDQTTVQCVTGAGPYTITPTNNASKPLVSGVAMLGGSGVYNITVSGSSMTLGSRLSDVPAGLDIGAGYVGMMRFWTAPAFGLLACKAAYDGAANTNFVMPATPCWLALAGNPTLAVDFYAADSSNGNPHGQVGGTATLTKYGAWAAGAAFAAGQKILVGQQVQTATTAGVSGGSVPAWNPAAGGNTVDGGVIWTAGGTVPIGVVAYAAGDFHAAAFLLPHLHYSGGAFRPEYDDNRPKGDFVQMQWGFNNRAAQSGYTGPAVGWNGANLGQPQPGTMQVVIGDANIRMSPCCPAVVGFVPFYSPLADTGPGLAPSDGTQPPPAGPVESFRNQRLFDFPGTFLFDDAFKAYWMGAVQTTMADPFWQAPFAPDCTGALQWLEDDGSGMADVPADPEGDPPVTGVSYYPARPLVEARATLPGNLGWGQNEAVPGLPTGVSLAYDVSKNVVSPEIGPPGIPIGNESGDFGSVALAYGFWLRACGNIAANGRFAEVYKLFVSC